MKRVLLTGATGFIGANLTRRLLQDGHELHLLVRRGYSPWRIEDIRKDVKLFEVDLGDEQSLTRVVAQIRPDWVFHLAAHGAYSWQTDLKQMVNTNILGTINLVGACMQTGFETFINTGSSSEYGFKNYAPSEKDWLEPNSYYAVTKSSATLYCRYVAQSRNVRMVTLRLYSVYGPYEDPRRLMPTIIVYGLRGELPPLVDPNTAHDYIYIADVCEAYLLAAAQSNQEPGAVYNVGRGVQVCLREVIQVAQQAMGINTEPQWGSMPNRQWDTNVWESNNQRICRELCWQPRYTFEQGFRLMVNWFHDNPPLLDLYTRWHLTNKQK